jgi:hypothetical protein
MRISHDVVIRVYDDAGNVIESTSTRAISKSGKVIAPDRVHRPREAAAPSLVPDAERTSPLHIA